MANHVIGRDLVKTLHSEGEPTFSATGKFETEEKTVTFPSLWSHSMNGTDVVKRKQHHGNTYGSPMEPRDEKLRRWA